MVLDKIRNLNSLLAMLLSADNEWQAAHQQQHIKMPDPNECQSCRSVQALDEWSTIDLPGGQVKLRKHNQLLVDMLSRITTIFLETIDRHLPLLRSIESVMEIVDVAWRLFGNQHSFRGLSIDIQRLLSLAMATILKTNQSLKDNYPVVWSIMQNHKDQSTINQFHQHLLETILSRDLHTFTDTMKTSYLDALKNCSKQFWEPNQVAINFHVLLYDLISVTDMCESISQLDLKQIVHQEAVASILQPLVCALSTNYSVVYSVTKFETILRCNVCCPINHDTSLPKDLLFVRKSNRYAQSIICENIIERVLEQLIQSDSTTVRLNVINALTSVAKHIPRALTISSSTISVMSLIADPSIEILQSLAAVLPDVLLAINTSNKISNSQKLSFLDQLVRHISTAVQGSLCRSDSSKQAAVLNLIRAVGCQPGLPEQRVLQTFLLTTFFVIRPESLESKSAALCAVEICFAANTNPRQLVCWYKEDVFKLLIAGAVNNFMRHGFGLNKSLTNVS